MFWLRLRAPARHPACPAALPPPPTTGGAAATQYSWRNVGPFLFSLTPDPKGDGGS